MDASKAVALVGKVAGPSLAILTNNAEKVADLSNKLDLASGTSAKFAETIGKTTAGRIAGLGSAIEGLAIAFFEKLQPAINLVIDVLTALASGFLHYGGIVKDFIVSAFSPLIEAFTIVFGWISKSISVTSKYVGVFGELGNMFSFVLKQLKKLLPLFKALLVGFASYQAVVIATTLAQKAYNAVLNAFTKSTKTAITGVKGLNKAMKANPIGLLIGTLTTVITLLFSFKEELKGILRWLGFNIEKTKELSRNQKVLNEVRTEHTKLVAEEEAKVKVLFEQLKKENLTKGEKKKLVDQINGQYGEYLDNLLTEKSSLTDIANAYNQVIAGIKTKIGAELKMKKMTKILTEENEAQAKVLKKINDFFKGDNKIKQAYGENSKSIALSTKQTQKYLNALVEIEKQGKTLSVLDLEGSNLLSGIEGEGVIDQVENLRVFKNAMEKITGQDFIKFNNLFMENKELIDELNVLYPDYTAKVKAVKPVVTDVTDTTDKDTKAKKANKKATDDLLNAEIKRLDLEKRKLEAQEKSLKVSREETKGIGVDQVIARNKFLEEETEIKARILEIEKRKAELQTNNAIKELEAKKATKGLTEAEAVNLETLKDKLVLINKEYKLQLDAMKKSQDAQKSEFIKAPELATQG